ncbi:hypothetical protein [Pacificibacter sp. AS14]|uniref:hypothetical protein n=1 Tax=Pacificibacter sp. AS14 TaxID=3135785 RepID=UPI0031714F0F
MIISPFGYKLAAFCLFVAFLSAAGMLFLYLNYQSHSNFDAILIVGFSILSALMSTALTVYLFDIALRKETETQLSQTIANSVDESVRRSLDIKSSGLKSVHASFDRNLFVKSARSSQDIFILQTYAPNLTGLRPAIIDTLNRGGNVKLLILDPASSFVDIRTSETRNVHANSEAFISEIEHSCISRFRSFVDIAANGQAELRVYDRSPGVCIYGTSNSMFVSPFLTELDAVSAPQVELSYDSDTYSVFLDHFNKVWENAKKIEV